MLFHACWDLHNKVNIANGSPTTTTYFLTKVENPHFVSRQFIINGSINCKFSPYIISIFCLHLFGNIIPGSIDDLKADLKYSSLLCLHSYFMHIHLCDDIRIILLPRKYRHENNLCNSFCLHTGQ